MKEIKLSRGWCLYKTVCIKWEVRALWFWLQSHQTWAAKLLEPKCNSDAKHLSAHCCCAAQAQLCQHPCDLEGTAPPCFTCGNRPVNEVILTEHSMLQVNTDRRARETHKEWPCPPHPNIHHFTDHGFLAGRECRSVTSSSSLLNGASSFSSGWLPPAVHFCRT